MTPEYLKPLGPDALRRLSIPEPWNFGIADRVRFSEIDALAHVNNIAPLRWFESLRVAYMSAYGQPYGAPDSPQIVVKTLSAEYHKPMFLGEDYVVTGRTSRVGRTSFVKEYAVFSGDLRYSGTAVMVCVTADGTATTPMLPEFRRQVIDRDGAQGA